MHIYVGAEKRETERKRGGKSYQIIKVRLP